MAEKTFPVPIPNGFEQTFDKFNEVCNERDINRSKKIRSFIELWTRFQLEKNEKKKRRLQKRIVQVLFYNSNGLPSQVPPA